MYSVGKGAKWNPKEVEEFEKPIIDKFESEGCPYFSSARYVVGKIPVIFL